MRVTKQDLKDFGLFDTLPEPFKKMEGDDFFVFYYDVDEDNIKLKIYETTIVKQVNVSLYRGLGAVANKFKTNTLEIGFFSDSNETKDGLFYQFLRSYNSAEAVSVFYSYAKEQDIVTDISVSTNAITEIYTVDDFKRSISYFTPSRLQTIMFVYDMVNSTFESRLSKSLYGSTIKKIVTLIKFNGGVLPEMNGNLRYMVIGENAVLNIDQIEKLEEAKLLLRSLQNPDKIYQYTGWAFSQNDGKWRTNIADNEAAILNMLLYDYNGRKLYKPEGSTPESIMQLLQIPDKIYNFNYRGRLIDVLSHPTLYEYYPRLALLPILYFFGDKSGSGKYDFHYSYNERGGYIVINGSKDCGNSLSILLHEIQHYIQRYEKFAEGGNQFFAQFVASVGGAMVRKIFSSINKMARYFKDELSNEQARIELLDLIKAEYPKNDAAKQLKAILIQNISGEDYFINYKSINFYLILLISENGDFSTSDIVLYLQRKFGDIVFELFQNVSEGYNSAKKYKEKLSSEGYRNDDISKILFKGYENLYGELESRSVQSSRLVESEYRNYFSLTKWGNSPLQEITVIDGIENIIDCTKIKAAVEEKNDEYVLHLERNTSCLPVLHELGHIVHDGLNTLGYKDKIESAFQKSMSDDIDEFFVSRFLGYLKERIDDNIIKQDFRLDFSISSSPEINKILDEFFADTNVDKRLNFIQTILST